MSPTVLGPLNLLASTSNCYIWPFLDSTPNPYSHITYLGSFRASVPLCSFDPTGWNAVVLEGNGKGSAGTSMCISCSGPLEFVSSLPAPLFQ